MRIRTPITLAILCLTCAANAHAASTAATNADTNALVKQHCGLALREAMVSPSSTRHDEPTVVTDKDGCGRQVLIEYDSANAYGAMLRGTVICSYSCPIVHDGKIDLDELVFNDDEATSELETRRLSLAAQLRMLREFFSYTGKYGNPEVGEEPLPTPTPRPALGEDPTASFEDRQRAMVAAANLCRTVGTGCAECADSCETAFDQCKKESVSASSYTDYRYSWLPGKTWSCLAAKYPAQAAEIVP